MTDAPSVRPSGRWRRPGPWLIASLVLAAAGLPGGLASAHVIHVAPLVGVGRPLSTGANFSVNLTDTPAFEPRSLSATVSGAVAVSVHLDNTGGIVHTFTLVNASQTGVVLNRSWTPQNLSAYFVAEPPLKNVSVAAHSTAWANFSLVSSPAFRSLEFVSTIPYQFQAGMWGFLNLTPTGPAVLLSENTTNAPGFQPDLLSAGPTVHGAVNLHVLVTNLGDLAHTFTVSSQPNVTFTSLASFQAYPTLVSATVPSSGSPPEVWANFTVPAVGVYEYVCTVTGHFVAGMSGFLYVGVPVPEPPPTPSTVIVGVPILVGAAVLLAVGVALTAATAYTGRFPKGPGARPPHA